MSIFCSVFFFKQKTAYEMRISDWSSDVCSSDLSAPDRLLLEANVEERSTGEIQLSAGYSSLERFIIQAGITQRNFRGKGQELRASVNYSSYSKSVQLGFTEPYLFDKSVAVGADIFRRSEEHTSELQSLMRNSYAVFCLKKK